MSNFFDSSQDGNTESKVLKENIIILYYTEIILMYIYKNVLVLFQTLGTLELVTKGNNYGCVSICLLFSLGTI